MKSTADISAAEFDRRFDAGEDISGQVDWSQARLVVPRRQVSVSLPAALLESLDREAARLSMTRERLLEVRLEERIAAAR
jgi:hypothetical protein